MKSQLIKTYEIPASVRKQAFKYTVLELYNDRLVGKGGKAGEKTYFFKNYMDVQWTPASVATQFAQLVFITHENASNYHAGGNLNSIADANKIPFCSGMFSYATANEYVKSLCEDVRKAMNDYQEAASEVSTAATVVAAVSPAEELKKFKELLDMGIITQAEFDTKKKQILGL